MRDSWSNICYTYNQTHFTKYSKYWKSQWPFSHTATNVCTCYDSRADVPCVTFCGDYFMLILMWGKPNLSAVNSNFDGKFVSDIRQVNRTDSHAESVVVLILSSLVAPAVVMTTISDATSDDKIMTTLGFQCQSSPPGPWVTIGHSPICVFGAGPKDSWAVLKHC